MRWGRGAGELGDRLGEGGSRTRTRGEPSWSCCECKGEV